MSKKNLIASPTIDSEVNPMDDYRVILANLPTSIRGYVFLESDGVPCIVLNSNLTREMNLRTMVHEMKHIANDELNDPTYHEYGGE